MQDFTTQGNPSYLFFAGSRLPFPEWVQNEKMPAAADFEKKASTAFADPQRRLLPICTKSAAFHSAINAFADPDAFSEEVFDRVKAACDFYGISAEVAPYADLFADRLEKVASTPSTGRFALDTEVGGQAYRLFPINDAEEIRSAQSDLLKMATEGRIPFLMFVPAAREIVKAASEAGIPVQYTISRVGDERLPDIEKAASLVKGRGHYAKLIDKAVAEEAYAEAVKEASTGDITAEECMWKIAAIDDAAGLRMSLHPSSSVLLPTDIVFCGTLQRTIEKAASEHVMVNDVLIPIADFKRLDMNEADFKLTKSASESLRGVISSEDAKDITFAAMAWEDNDRRTLLRMVAKL